MTAAAKTRILVVEDDPSLARALTITLRARGYEVLSVPDGTRALQVLADGGADLVVLDLGLPDMDGVEVLRAVRHWSSVPVVVLSARQTSDDKVEALDAGADDYVTKPFGMPEFLARVRAAQRRAPADGESPLVETAAFTIDLAHRRVLKDGEEVRLTPTEWRLLELLARHAGRLVGQRELLQELRGPNLEGETHYLRVYLAQLRRKLEPDPGRPRHLLTEPGVGYRLMP